MHRLLCIDPLYYEKNNNAHAYCYLPVPINLLINLNSLNNSWHTKWYLYSVLAGSCS